MKTSAHTTGPTISARLGECSDRIVLLTAKNDLAADLLVIALKRLGESFVRINLEDFPSRCRISWRPDGGTEIVTPSGLSVRTDYIRSAWYRKPPPLLPTEAGSLGVDEFITAESHAMLQGVWQTMDCFWVNNPSSVRVSENKLAQLVTARRYGFRTPRTLVSNSPEEVRSFAKRVDAVVAKPIFMNYLRDHSTIFTTRVALADLDEDTAILSAPCIFQEYVPKVADVRVTVVGSYIYAAEIRMDDDIHSVDWRAVSEAKLSYRLHHLPGDLAVRCVSLVRDFGLAFGALDFLYTASGEYVFLEVNPSGQWGWIEHATGQPITKAIAELLAKGYVA